MITLYSTHCPKCKVLELKLNQKKINYNIVDDPDAVVDFGKENNILSAPILDIDGKIYEFSSAIKAVNSL